MKRDAKERGKRKEIVAIQQNPFSGERSEGWRHDWKDKQMERRQKREAGERKRLPFLSPDENKRGCGERAITEDGGEEKRRDVIRG